LGHGHSPTPGTQQRRPTTGVASRTVKRRVGVWVPHSGYMWSTLRALLELLLELLFGGGPLPPSRLTVVTKLDKPRLAAARGAFVDGAVLADGSCGAAVFYSAGHELNTHGRLTLPAGAPADSNLAELAALAHCLLRHPRGEPLAVFSDSMHALRCAQAAAESGGGGRGRGRRRVSDQTQDGRWGGLVLLIQLLLRLRRGRTAFFKVQAHKGNRSNEIADALAQKGAGGDGSPLPLPAFSGGGPPSAVRRRLAACRWALSYLLAHPPEEQAAAARHGRGRDGNRRHLGGASKHPARRAGSRHDAAPPPPTRREAVAVGSGAGAGGVLAVDCEMVGVGASGLPSKLASVCVVNEAEEVVYFSYCRPPCAVTDYRTRWSGVTAPMLATAPPFEAVSREVSALLKGKVVVGHDLQHDFAALGFGHPRRLVRDTARGLPSLLGTRAGRPRKLRHLAAEFLQWRIQEGCHSPEEDAAAAMRLYRRFRPQFELAVARAEERREEARRRRAAAAEAGDDGEGAEWGESDQVGPVGGAGEASGAGSSSEPGGSSTKRALSV